MPASTKRKGTVYLHEFDVEGASPFPIDMLRHDTCYPATEADSATILSTAQLFYRGIRRVRLRMHCAGPNQGPTKGRWLSFGWRVVEDGE